MAKLTAEQKEVDKILRSVRVPPGPTEIERMRGLSRGAGRKVLIALERKGHAVRREDGRWWPKRKTPGKEDHNLKTQRLHGGKVA